MNLSTARDYFALGVLESCEIRQTFGPFDGWTVEFFGKLGNARPLLETARGDIRQFKTLDAAAAAAREVGFVRFAVLLD